MPEDVCVSLELPAGTAFACPVAGLAGVLAERAVFGQRERSRFQLTVEEFRLSLAGLAADNRPRNITSRATTGTLDAPIEAMGVLLAGKAFVRNPDNPTGSWWNRVCLERFLTVLDGRASVGVDEAYPHWIRVTLARQLAMEAFAKALPKVVEHA